MRKGNKGAEALLTFIFNQRVNGGFFHRVKEVCATLFFSLLSRDWLIPRDDSPFLREKKLLSSVVKSLCSLCATFVFFAVKNQTLSLST
jgi:hypothetical protein